MDTTVSSGGQTFSAPQFAYSTADIEHGLFYESEHRDLNALRSSVSLGVSGVVSIAGSYFVVDEVTPGPWMPLAPNAGLFRLGVSPVS